MTRYARTYKKITNNEIHKHYLGKNIQNEIINLLSTAIEKRIITNLKTNKYYSIIVDCTSDVSHTKQMTIIVRYINILTSPNKDGKYFEVCERFLGFIDINDSTGKGLTEKIFEVLQIHDLSLCDLRGQGYDNGSNMRGNHSGVQSRTYIIFASESVLCSIFLSYFKFDSK